MRQKVTEHVAMVKSAECGTLKILMKKIISQLYMAGKRINDTIVKEKFFVIFYMLILLQNMPSNLVFHLD